MRIRPEEAELAGSSQLVNGTVESDAVTKRIHDLTRGYLTKIAESESGWETLYRDPADLRLWELTYPQSRMHGGGPPTFRSVFLHEARSKYRLPAL